MALVYFIVTKKVVYFIVTKKDGVKSTILLIGFVRFYLRRNYIIFSKILT